MRFKDRDNFKGILEGANMALEVVQQELWLVNHCAKTALRFTSDAPVLEPFSSYSKIKHNELHEDLSVINTYPMVIYVL